MSQEVRMKGWDQWVTTLIYSRVWYLQASSSGSVLIDLLKCIRFGVSRGKFQDSKKVLGCPRRFWSMVRITGL